MAMDFGGSLLPCRQVGPEQAIQPSPTALPSCKPVRWMRVSARHYLPYSLVDALNLPVSFARTVLP